MAKQIQVKVTRKGTPREIDAPAPPPVTPSIRKTWFPEQN